MQTFGIWKPVACMGENFLTKLPKVHPYTISRRKSHSSSHSVGGRVSALGEGEK